MKKGPTNKPPTTAVALQYDGTGAPKVTAKGSFLVAERILELADEHGIPLHEDADLVTLLAQLDLGTEIPANLFIAVAEVIAFAYRVTGTTLPTATQPR